MSSKTNVGGLDIATTTGLAVKKNGVITTKSYRLSAPAKEPFHLGDPRNETVEKVFGVTDKTLVSMHEGKLGVKFWDYLDIWFEENEIGFCGIELPLPSNMTRVKTTLNPDADFAGQSFTKTEESGTSMSAIFRAYGLEFMAATICARHNIKSEFVPQQTWRKYFLGTGRPPGGSKGAKKMAMAKCAAMGIAVPNEDAAEAAGVCWYSDSIIDPYGVKRANDLFASSR